MRIWVLTALLCALTRVAIAQPLPARTYSVADGLAHDRVKRIVVDTRGLLWFCTAQGLGRFDGSRFTTYREADGLPFDSINDLIETRDGDYWLATNGAGAARVAAGTTFTAVTVGASAATNRVNVLYEDAARRLWAGTDAGLFVRDANTGAFEPVRLADTLPRGIEPQIWTIAENAAHDLLIGTGAGLVARTPGGTQHLVAIDGRADRSITALLPLNDVVWIGHTGGLATLASTTAGATAVVTTSSAVQALTHRDGQVWAGTLTGELFAVDVATRDVVARHENLARSGILSLTVDRASALWIGTRAEGTLRLLSTALVPFAERDGLPPQPVRSIVESQRGDVYVVSLRPSNPLFVFDESHFVEVPVANVAGAVPQIVQQDRRGGWWIGSAGGLAQFAPAPTVAALRTTTPLATYTTRNGLPHANVLTLFEDTAERMWVGGWAAGHATYVDARRSTVHNLATPDIGLRALQPSTFAEDSSGNVWIGGRNGEVARYRRGTLEAITAPRPLRQVTGMLVDRSGRLWISSAGGLFRIDAPADERPTFVTINGLSSTMTRFVVEDALGRFYVGLPSGVNRLDPNTGVVELYTPADGLRGSELTTSLRDRTGHLWFGTHNGVTRLAPTADATVSPAAHAYIGAMRVAGVAQPGDVRGAAALGPVALDWTQNNVAIDYFAVTFRVGESVTFRYRLEGADEDWSAPTAATTVTYASLPPGSYRFAVQPVTSNTVDAIAPATVAFVIQAPFWQRGWFLALAAVALVGGVWTVYRARIARLLEVERLRTRIATDLHDDIGASLSRITVLSEVARQRLAAHPDERQMLSTIADTSRGMIDAMSDIVWTISPDRDTIRDLTQRMREFASDQLEARDIDFVFDTPSPDAQQLLGLATRRELLLIFKEAITNSARHSGATIVRSALSLEGGTIRLEVADDGRGFSPQLVQDDDGNGLGNMARRAQAIGGQLDIDSSAARGTTIVVTAPLRR